MAQTYKNPTPIGAFEGVLDQWLGIRDRRDRNELARRELELKEKQIENDAAYREGYLWMLWKDEQGKQRRWRGEQPGRDAEAANNRALAQLNRTREENERDLLIEKQKDDRAANTLSMAKGIKFGAEKFIGYSATEGPIVFNRDALIKAIKTGDPIAKKLRAQMLNDQVTKAENRKSGFTHEPETVSRPIGEDGIGDVRYVDGGVHKNENNDPGVLTEGATKNPNDDAIEHTADMQADELISWLKVDVLGGTGYFRTLTDEMAANLADLGAAQGLSPKDVNVLIRQLALNEEFHSLASKVSANVDAAATAQDDPNIAREFKGAFALLEGEPEKQLELILAASDDLGYHVSDLLRSTLTPTDLKMESMTSTLYGPEKVIGDRGLSLGLIGDPVSSEQLKELKIEPQIGQGLGISGEVIAGGLSGFLNRDTVTRTLKALRGEKLSSEELSVLKKRDGISTLERDIATKSEELNSLDPSDTGEQAKIRGEIATKLQKRGKLV
ncbi:uncharacterized protein METZ01_LOCUS195871, partial [marine metagenome]